MNRTLKTILIFGVILLSISSCSDKGSQKLLENLLIMDDFSDVESGWKRIDESQITADYKSGGYLLGVHMADGVATSPIGQSFADVIIEVDATFSSGGTENPFGIICRYEDEDNFYALFITAEGDFGILKNRGLDVSLIGTDGLGYSDAIKKGDEKNVLRAECVGEHFALYANGELLVEVYDADAPQGDIGLFAGAFGSPNIEVSFDNFAVYKP
jgi:hypothetical protein